jgi:hypothetical protein
MLRKLKVLASGLWLISLRDIKFFKVCLFAKRGDSCVLATLNSTHLLTTVPVDQPSSEKLLQGGPEDKEFLENAYPTAADEFRVFNFLAKPRRGKAKGHGHSLLRYMTAILSHIAAIGGDAC